VVAQIDEQDAEPTAMQHPGRHENAQLMPAGRQSVDHDDSVSAGLRGRHPRTPQRDPCLPRWERDGLPSRRAVHSEPRVRGGRKPRRRPYAVRIGARNADGREAVVDDDRRGDVREQQ
jgi:hypothetical protein